MLLRSAVAAAAVLAAGLLIAPGTALAADSAPHNRATMQFDCAGIGTVTLVAPPTAAHDNWSAAQVVTGGHLIPVAIRYRVFDDTADAVLDDETVAHPAAHGAQPTTTCAMSQTAILGDVAPPDAPLPAGVLPTDTVTMSIIVTAVAKF